MKQYDEVLKEEIEIQEQITPDDALEMQLKHPQEFKEIIGDAKQ